MGLLMLLNFYGIASALKIENGQFLTTYIHRYNKEYNSVLIMPWFPTEGGSSEFYAVTFIYTSITSAVTTSIYQRWDNNYLKSPLFYLWFCYQCSSNDLCRRRKEFCLLSAWQTFFRRKCSELSYYGKFQIWVIVNFKSLI